MKIVSVICLILFLIGNCRSKTQVEESRKMSGISSETSDIVISDSAAKQTKGVAVGGTWIVPNHLLLENISAPANIQQFYRLLEGTDLKETLSDKGPFTLFIPTDAAFQKLPAGFKQQLFTSSAKKQRINLIKRHLVPGKIVATDLKDEVILKAADGHNLQVQNKGRTIKVDEAIIIIKDGVSNNGVVHIIDRVLQPGAKP